MEQLLIYPSPDKNRPFIGLITPFLFSKHLQQHFAFTPACGRLDVSSCWIHHNRYSPFRGIFLTPSSPVSHWRCLLHPPAKPAPSTWLLGTSHEVGTISHPSQPGSFWPRRVGKLLQMSWIMVKGRNTQHVGDK